MAATEKQWYVGEDGCISVGVSASAVTYHSALNSIIVSTKEPSVKIYDVASGALLQKSDLSANTSDAIHAIYLPGKDKVIFADDYSVGARNDLRGMLLLDTALQTPINKSEDQVKVEIPLAEAGQFHKALMNAELPGIDHVDEVCKELEKKIDAVQEATKGHLKAAKWATICLELPLTTLKAVCTGLVNEMKRLSMNNPGLSVASAIGDRLNYLLPNNGEGWSSTVERSMMYSEVARQKTFRTWPHMNYKWALPDPMSQAGFYHQPNSMGDDRAMCFTCNVCLVCWEPTDEPWSEHERHSPTCPFVKGEYTQNVPLAVTYGSQPAKRHSENDDKIECMSTTATENFVATSTLNGNIVVWNVDKILKKYCQFNLDPSNPVIALKTGLQIERLSERSPKAVDGDESLHDETDAKPENTVKKVENGVSTESGGEPSTATTSTNSTAETLYELPQEKLDKSDGLKTRNRPCEDVLVKSMCIVRKPVTEKSSTEKSNGAKISKAKKKSRSKPHPTLFCGVSLRRTRMSLPLEQNNVECETEEVELMNKVNEVVSSDSPQIISSEEESFCGEGELVDNELLQSTVFIPYLLVLALRDDVRKGMKQKEKEQKRMLPSSASLNNLNAVPNLGSISMMNHDFSLMDPMFDSDPDMLIGVTPGPVSLTSEGPSIGMSNSVPDAKVPTVSKPSGSSRHTKTGSVLQCVELPQRLQSDRFKVSTISPILDGQHILVVVSPADRLSKSSTKSKSVSVISDSSPTIEASGSCDECLPVNVNNGSNSIANSSENISELSSSLDQCLGGCVLLYKYKFSEDYAQLEETPVVTKYLEQAELSVTSVIVLPQEFSEYQEREEESPGPESLATNSASTQMAYHVPGQAVVTLSNGKLWLLNLNDLSVVAEISPPEPEEKFVSAAYCTGMERLCVCSAEGKLHFYQLSEDSPVLSESGSLMDVPDGVCNGESRLEPDLSSSNTESTESKEHLEKNSPGTDLLAKKSLTVENLMLLHNLIQFENLMPRFTSTVPSCWTEIQQEQQQRRHPQHLQHQGEATQHTRTWKLQPDSSTWDEHLFEIVLPRPCCVGHVDIKFSLHPMCTSPPDVQITLLKQNVTTLGRQSNTMHPAEVDKSIDFNINAFCQAEEENTNSSCTEKSNGRFGENINSVLDPEFLEDHNAEILCGPVNLASFLDLSGNGGLITLTSPQLLSTKPKAFLLHIKGFHSKNDDKNNEKQREMKKKSSSSSSTQKMIVMKSAFDKDIFIPTSKVKEAMTAVPRPKFADNFRGCDWIQEISVTIRKTKRTQIPKERLQRSTMIENLKFHERLMSAVGMSDGYVFSGISSDCYQNMALDILLWISGVQMNDPIRRAAMKTIPYTLKTHLHSVVRACFIQGTRTTAHKCSRLLAMCMEQCKKMADPDMASGFIQCKMEMSSIHALLKSRFGLYGHPFDPDLFDIELPLALKHTVPSVSFSTLSSSGSNSTTSGNTNNNLTAPSASSSVTDELDYYDLFNPPSDKSQKVQLEYAKGSLFGLMEVEPLHFTCHSTSDGTKMERMDNNSTSQSTSIGTAGLSGTINFGEGIPPQATGNIGASTLASLSSSMAVTKQHLHELSSKSYPTFKHKIMHIKQILSEVGKSLPPEGKATSSDLLMPPTPKSTPMVITPPLTPPNETFLQGQGTATPANDGKSDNNKHFSAKSALGGLPNAQTLLQQPPLQVLVIERMHSGARRFVTLDFGKPIVLTDVVIPACTDLASLSIDVWVQGEELDGQRFVVASDIGVRSLIMTDIMPPVVCRYLKITTIGRFGSGSTRSKIPIGAFYGHSCLLPWEWNSYLEQRSSSTTGSQSELPTQSQMLAQLGIYMSLLEDIQCRYSLARTRLESLLAGLDGQQFANTHIQYFLKKSKKQNEEDNKIIQSYNDCLQLQVQLNLAKKATERLHTALGFNVPKTDYGGSVVERIQHACTDKLRFVQECLLEVVLSMTSSSASIPQPPVSLYNLMSPQAAEMLFKNLCVHGTKKIQISCGMLLMRVCGSQPWWGSFLGNVLREFFHSENSQIFPQDRVFVLLLAMGQKSLSGPSAVSIMESLLDMLARVLSPLVAGQAGMIDLTLVGWILLFLCRSLDHTSLNNDDSSKAARRENGNSLPNRWNFIQGDHNSAGSLAASNAKAKSTKLVRGSRLSMQKRMLHHKQKLMDLQQAQKTFFSTHPDKAAQNSSNTLLKQQEKEFKKELSKYASKHIKDIIHMRRTEVEMLRKMGPRAECVSESEKSNGEVDQEGVLLLSKEKTLRVVRGLMCLLLSMDFTCNVDLFLITCKVIATVCVSTRPAITLAEAMTQEQLERLILLASNLEFSYGNVSWGGPWAGHAITCLLQDILDGERFYPAHLDSSVSDTREEATGGFTTETDESLPHSVSLPTMEDLDTDQDNSVPDTPEMELSDSKEEPSKMAFDKESSLMVDLLLDDMDYEDDASAKLHAYVTGESVVPPPPPPPEQILFESGLPTSSLNGTLDVANSIPETEDKKKDVFIKKIVDKITERDRESWTSGSSYRSSLVAGAQGMSTAMDARLEFGLETQAELRLKVMLSLHTEGVQQAFSNTLPPAPYVGHSLSSAPPPTDDELSQATASFSQSEVSSAEMLSSCYNNLLCHLLPQCSNLDSLLQLWLTLNSEGNTDASGGPIFDSSRTPLILLSSSSVSTLLEVLTAIPSLPISSWVLAFQSLTLIANQRIPGLSEVGEVSMIVPLLSDPNLISVIKKFLSGTSDNGPTASSVQFSTVGPAATKAFYEFLLRLLGKCPQDYHQKLKELMLKLVYTLSAERGAFHCGLGPLDAQCKFMDFILDQTYENVDLSNAISVIESISSLVHQHILCQEKVSCRSTSENSVNARSCFGGLFASFLRGGDSKTSDASRDLLMCSLLKLVNNLIQIQCSSPRNARGSSVAMDSSATVEPMTPTNISMSEPVPDSAKLEQALATSTPTPGVRLSDEEKSQQTDEQKTETLNTQAYVTDLILGHHQIMCNLIQALSYCNSNTMAMILGSRGISSNMQETFTGGEPISVGDGIYQILVTLTRLCSDSRCVIESLYKYLSGSYSVRTQQSLNKLSEPLLWFILKVLDSARSINTFLEMGGISIICQNLVNCNCRIISTNPSLISTIMQNLNGRSRLEKKNSDFESPDGLQNFAPLGYICSSSPTASPAEVLIQSSPPHRRARSAAWSYHFYPDEAWVDLTIQLPFAVLLKEVQIQPHGTSLTTCPSSVSLELSHDGVTSTPLCHPLMTSSLAFIKLQFQRPQIATMVTIRLHKARDSMTIGLSQIMLMGYSAFGDSSSAPQNVFMPNEDYVARSSVRWIRLLHHCLTAYKEVEEAVANSAAQIPNLMNTCSALLVSPISSVYVPNIEEVLLCLGLHSVDMGLALVDNILRSPSNRANSGFGMPYLGKVSGQANESTVELLYQLGMVQDHGTRLRVQALLSWLKDSARLALQRSSLSTSEGYRRVQQELSSLPSPAPSHIQVVSAILWQSNDLPVEYDLGGLVTRELVSFLYEWSTTLKTDNNLKQSVDYILCAICHINPEYFSQILLWMGITVTGENSLSASISDDRKDNSHLHQGSMTDDSKDNRHHRSMTDDSKEASSAQEGPRSQTQERFPQDFHHITLEESCLSTLALTCQSAVAIKQLLDSGFPAVLAQGLFEFCNKVIFQFTENYSPPEGMTDAHKSMCDEGGASGSVLGSMSRTVSDKALWITADMVPSVLYFLAKVSTEPLMKDWLGGHEGNIFWPSLLTMLCNTPIQSTTAPASIPREGIMTMENRGSIESAAVCFFTQVMSCHIINQLLFAKVLSEVIKEQSSSSKSGQLLGNFPLSGFTRCLFLQALLEDEKVLVVLKSGQQSGKIMMQPKLNNGVHHPRFTGGRNTQVMLVSLHTTISEITSKVTDLPLLPGQFLEKASEKSDESKKDNLSNYTEMASYLSSSVVAASMAAKEKREKEDKSGKTSLPPRPPTRRGRQNLGNSSSQMPLPTLGICHKSMPNTSLPGELTLSQLLQVLHQRGLQHGLNVLEFSIKQDEKKDTNQPDQSERDGWGDLDEDQALTTVSPFPTSLQVFASVGGLALLAEHLPLLYPEVSRQSIMQESGLDNMIKNMSIAEEWSMIEPFPEDFYEHYELSQPLVAKTSNPPVALPTIPPHSLVAFGLFLRLPGYAEVLLKERKKAQCLLRLVLGVTDDGDGGHILTSPIACSLPTLPFLVLKSLYDSSPLTTDDGVLLRRMSLDIWAIHLILACLSVLSHHAPRVPVQGFQQEAQLILSAMQSANTPASVPVQTQTEEKSQQYWAKGTGFGTGSTTSSWDAEQALMRQKSEEEHVACLLQVLASYVNPGGDIPKEFESENFTSPAEKSLLPDVIYELLSQSCIVPAISSYLRNDSVLDMARHIPLYRALLELLRGIAVTPSLVPLLLPLEKDNGPESATSVGVLLDKMRVCVDTYASRLKSNKAKNENGSVAEEEENEGLAMLIPNIQETARIVKIATERLQKSTETEGASEEAGKDKSGQAGQASAEEHYMTIMQEEQFGSFEFVLDDSSAVKFTCSHHYENNVKAAGEVSNASRTRRLAQEATTLSTSLPLSAGSSVFVRCDEERLDIMKVMITGPSDTPYENGCFEFDVYFPPDYPTSPPLINLETTGNHTIRFNPNLYNDGKVCLSVLNTWHGRPEEKWNAQTSSFLQVLVSIQSLILVSEPYFNEPGYERSRGTPSGTASSREYDANIRQATVKWAMLEQIKNPTPCFREVIHKHFWLKRHEVLKQCENWIAEMESYSNDKRTGRTIAHSTLALKRHYNQLREEIAKMKPPEGLEDEEGGETIDPQGVHFSTDSALSSAMNSSQMGAIENLITDSNSNSVLEDGFC
ncbi:baculoviral IAP repeat-containing protein 6-like [Saccostrea cucullata]|uniref:baculoviral IAP repeat-containing protein 6-like n=1 Tax=Saccostrea cuccullata TaxID=36930 RepID=UPI002ED66B62